MPVAGQKKLRNCLCISDRFFMQPSHIPFGWLKTMYESIVRKQLIVKPDAPGRQFLALISDHVNTQITASGKLTHPNHPKVTQSWKQTGKIVCSGCYFVKIFAENRDTKKSFPVPQGVSYWYFR
jgi:hypothetical protein